MRAMEQYFLSLWTLKEAYIKAQGRGVFTPPGMRGFTMSVVRRIRRCVFHFA